MSIRQYLEDDESSRSTPESLYINIREDILSGKLDGGSRLTEQSICERYHVSRTPVREALSRLESEGLIRLLKNRGAVICSLSQSDLDDLLRLKEQAELIAIERAIESIEKTDLDDLDELFEFMEFYTSKNDIDRMININSAFHKLIYHCTHNWLLERRLNQYQLYIDELCPENYYANNYLRDVLTEHRAIYDAIRKKDVPAGLEAIRVHLDHTRKRMVRS